MIALVTAAIGLGLYVLSLQLDIAFIVGIGIAVLVLTALLVATGAYFGADAPKWSRWLLWMWTPGVVLVLGALAAIAAYLGVIATAGKDAPVSQETFFGLLGALITAIATNINGWLEKHLAPWISAIVVCRRYRSLFPCTPEGLGPGRQAQEAVSDGCANREPENWKGPKVEATLKKIQAAIAADEVHGGAKWKCLGPSPAPSANT